MNNQLFTDFEVGVIPPPKIGSKYQPLEEAILGVQPDENGETPWMRFKFEEKRKATLAATYLRKRATDVYKPEGFTIKARTVSDGDDSAWLYVKRTPAT
jgi:hypothetical protein